MEDDKLRHWFRDAGDPNHFLWRSASEVTDQLAGPGSIIQSDFRGSSGHGNFEVVVPRVDPGTGRVDLWHFFSETSDAGTSPWQAADHNPIVPDVAGPGCIIQSDFKGSSGHGNFEVIVPRVDPATGRVDLWHFFSETSDAGTSPWQAADHNPIVPDVAGPGCIIQSDFKGSSGHGNFEVIVPRVDPATGRMDLWHFFSETSDAGTSPWQAADHNPIVPDVAGPGCIIQSDFKGSSGHGNFEVVVPVPRPGGTQLRHFFTETSNQGTAPWQRGQFITDSCNGWGCLLQRTEPLPHGTFETLVEECTQSVVNYQHPHDNDQTDLPWLRQSMQGTVIFEPDPPRVESTRRITQLTG